MCLLSPCLPVDSILSLMNVEDKREDYQNCHVYHTLIHCYICTLIMGSSYNFRSRIDILCFMHFTLVSLCFIIMSHNNEIVDFTFPAKVYEIYNNSLLRAT